MPFCRFLIILERLYLVVVRQEVAADLAGNIKKKEMRKAEVWIKLEWST